MRKEVTEMENNTGTALSGMDDDRAYYTFSGDLNQMGTIEKALREAGFPVVKNNVYPGFPKNKKAVYIRALKYLWEHRTHGWWNQEEAFVKNGICTQEEFDHAMGRTQ
jgi:hypothetical protein